MDFHNETTIFVEQQNHMSPILCRQGILLRFEELVNQLATGWKYHVANTDGIKDAWTRFEDYYKSVCSFTQGILKIKGFWKRLFLFNIYFILKKIDFLRIFFSII